MNFWQQDGVNIRTNSWTITGGGGVSYNAVIETTFDDTGAIEPVTLQEAKDFCRIDVSDDDLLITMIIKGARMICEHYANLSFIERIVTAKIHNGLGNFNLPYGPVIGFITSFTDVDGDSLDTTYDLRDAYGNDFNVVYNAGYATLPENLKLALLNQIAFMYENRGDVAIASGLSLGSKLILQQIRSV